MCVLISWNILYLLSYWAVLVLSYYLYYRYSVDYDVTAFVNDVTPPFDRVLDDFQDVIMMHFGLSEEETKTTSRSVGFTLEGIDFDLLPATNLARSQMGG